jgi:uncharacterized surface protein with fasciclin (FAS1) repeats
MKYFQRLICLLSLSLALVSCKNKTEEPAKKQEVAPKVEKKVLSSEETNQVNSIMAKAMVTPELKKFVSMIVTTGLANMLIQQEGAYTILAPSDAALAALDKTKMDFLLNQKNKDALIKLVNSHIVVGVLDSASIVQNIKKGNGSYKIITLSGVTYTATKEGSNIVITDVNEVKAVVGKSDIIGSNGVLHVLDAVLGGN